jgi:preprotein translocase subunit SecD
MNQYSIWRYLFVLVICSLGFLYALPNYYGHDHALQINGLRGNTIDKELLTDISSKLDDAGVVYKSVRIEGNSLLLRFISPQNRRAARDVLGSMFEPGDYVVAFSLASAMPDWLKAIGGKPLSMGLDLRGGVHFLMQVDTNTVKTQTEERFISELKAALRKEKVRYRSITRSSEGGLELDFTNAEMNVRARSIIKAEFPELTSVGNESGDTKVKLDISEQTLSETQKAALQQNLQTLRNRVNEFGVSEPVIQQQGVDRIVVQLPGVEDTAEAKKILGATATLEFRMVDLSGDVAAAVDGSVPIKSKLYYERDGTPVLLDKRVMLTGEYIIDASSGLEAQSGTPAVFITLNGKGARIFSRATGERIGQPMAVVYLERRNGRQIEEVINIATIQGQLSKRFQISGLDTTEEARTLALLLRAGALAAPIEIVEERTVGPSLGQDNIERGFNSMIIGMFFVLVFMAIYYKVFGLIANIAVITNVVMIVSLLSILQATLTLPGIAGIVLTVGMAVDANVLIFQRIREEIKNGNSPQMSISAGYDKAFSTIADANITTLIAAVVLFSFGTGPIKGFAVTLSLGIVTSMFTAIVGTRALVNLLYGKKKLARLSV